MIRFRALQDSTPVRVCVTAWRQGADIGMAWRDGFNQNKTLITAIHIIAWAVLSGVGVVVIILAGLFSLGFMIGLMITSFLITIPISFYIAKAINGGPQTHQKQD